MTRMMVIFSLIVIVGCTESSEVEPKPQESTVIVDSPTSVGCQSGEKLSGENCVPRTTITLPDES